MGRGASLIARREGATPAPGRAGSVYHPTITSDRPLKRDDFSSNRHHALAHCLSMIFFRKPVSTFRDHALERDGQRALGAVAGGCCAALVCGQRCRTTL